MSMPGKQTKPEGPAAGTRSRTISGLPGKGQPKDPTCQRLLSQYFYKGSNSDTEYDIPRKLKSRSLSGNLYQSSYVIKDMNAKEISLEASNKGVEDIVPASDQPCMENTKGITAAALGTTKVNVCTGEQTRPNVINVSNAIYTTPTCLKTLTPATSSITVSHYNNFCQVQTTPSIQHSVNTTSNIHQTGMIPYNHINNPRPSGEVHWHGNIANNNMFPQFQFSQPTQVYDYTQGMSLGEGINIRHKPVLEQSNSNELMISMLQSMNEKLNAIQGDVKTLMDSKQEITEQIAGIQFDQEDEQEKIESQQKDQCVCRDQVDLLTNLVIRQDDQMDEMKSRLLQLEHKQVRSELIIFGIIDQKEKKCAELAKEFFSGILGLTEIGVDHAYWKGKSNNKPMVVRLTTPKDKGLIYSKSTKLKDLKNANDKGYRIQDHLPEEMAEPQMRQRQIAYENKKLGEGQKQNMVFKKGNLLINNEPYKKKVQAPQAKQLLQMEQEELNETKDITVAGGHSETEGGSQFIAYATKVRTLQEVCKAYLHLKRLHAGSNHVTMAYRLGSLDKANDEDYVDDREFNAGRKLLQLLINGEHESVAIFMVRYYGGKHIGPKRYEIHAKLAIMCLADLNNDICFTSKLKLRQYCEQPKSRRKYKNKSKSSVPPSTMSMPPPRIPNMYAPRAAQPWQGTRFESEAYNRFTLLQNHTSADESPFTDFDPAEYGRDPPQPMDQQSHPCVGLKHSEH